MTIFKIRVYLQKREMMLVFLFLICIQSLFGQSVSSAFDGLIKTDKTADSFVLVDSIAQASIYFDPNDEKGVKRAIEDLNNDIFNVTGRHLDTNECQSLTYSGFPLIVGTIGHSCLIDDLIAEGKLTDRDLRDKWESFVIAIVDSVSDKVGKALVIAGSDRRGTIYGIYELSKQLGVSPWYWWADAPIKKKKRVFVTPGYRASGEPKVRYRGIFINDEIPCMKAWAKEKFGGMNSKMYTHVFELLLRLRGNCLWPGMWGSFKEYCPGVPILIDGAGEYEGNCFNEDDPDNPKLANEYGIIMGTSHHEPMQRSQQEWLRHRSDYGNGEWNYLTNHDGVSKFFKEGIENSNGYERIVTIGMRGDDDKPMADAGSMSANFRLLEKIMGDQRKIISNVTKKHASHTPQVWTLYSEVLDYYDKGINIPDDVMIMLCDDNWGDVRRLPKIEGLRHPGGYGMYYHVGLYGAPRAYKWLNMTQIQHMWEQLQLTYSHGVDKIWILNVGDIKPCEYPMTFFLEMAWNPDAFNAGNLKDFAKCFCREQFGEEEASEASEILETYCKYSARVTAEMLSENTYKLQNGEFRNAANEFMALETLALRQYLRLAPDTRDCYRQLILFPVQAMANLYELYYCVAMNHRMAKLKDKRTNKWADKAECCFRRDKQLCQEYNHEMSKGKWNHMMDQVHIGYTTWHAPEHNVMPEIKRISADDVRSKGCVFSSEFGVTVIEAEHFNASVEDQGLSWTVIPDLGRTESSIALMPYMVQPEDSYLSYKIRFENKPDSVKVHLVFGTTLPYADGGHHVKIGFKGQPFQDVDINSDLTWENNYSRMYPAAAARNIEKTVTLPVNFKGDECQELIYQPLSAGVTLQKIIIDIGGYAPSFLRMNESNFYRE